MAFMIVQRPENDMKALRDGFEKLSIGKLDGAHFEMLDRVIENIWSTPIAELSFVQIVDGLPLSKVAFDGFMMCFVGHPLLSRHQDLCSGVLDHTRTLRGHWSLETSKMDSRIWLNHTIPDYKRTDAYGLHQLIRDYLAASPGPGVFNTRLIEMVARAVHQIAAWLYNQDKSRHKEDDLGVWRPPKEDERKYPATFPSTLFCHPWYRDFDQYPEGIADSVGYWAEGRIFGGVVLFDRRDSNSMPEAEVSSTEDESMFVLSYSNHFGSRMHPPRQAPGDLPHLSASRRAKAGTAPILALRRDAAE